MENQTQLIHKISIQKYKNLSKLVSSSQMSPAVDSEIVTLVYQLTDFVDSGVPGAS